MYSPWSNGLNEINHYSAVVVVKKLMDEDKKMELSEAVEMTAWTQYKCYGKWLYTFAIGDREK